MFSTSTNIKTFVSALAFATLTAQGAPLTKRIAQVIADSTAKWEQACVSRVLLRYLFRFFFQLFHTIH